VARFLTTYRLIGEVPDMAVEEGDLPLLDLHLGVVILEIGARHKLLLCYPAPSCKKMNGFLHAF
jgi:hypothetical protein